MKSGSKHKLGSEHKREAKHEQVPTLATSAIKQDISHSPSDAFMQDAIHSVCFKLHQFLARIANNVEKNNLELLPPEVLPARHIFRAPHNAMYQFHLVLLQLRNFQLEEQAQHPTHEEAKPLENNIILEQKTYQFQHKPLKKSFKEVRKFAQQTAVKWVRDEQLFQRFESLLENNISEHLKEIESFNLKRNFVENTDSRRIFLQLLYSCLLDGNHSVFLKKILNTWIKPLLELDELFHPVEYELLVWTYNTIASMYFPEEFTLKQPLPLPLIEGCISELEDCLFNRQKGITEIWDTLQPLDGLDLLPLFLKHWVQDIVLTHVIETLLKNIPEPHELIGIIQIFHKGAEYGYLPNCLNIEDVDVASLDPSQVPCVLLAQLQALYKRTQVIELNYGSIPPHTNLENRHKTHGYFRSALIVLQFAIFDITPENVFISPAVKQELINKAKFLIKNTGAQPIELNENMFKRMLLPATKLFISLDPVDAGTKFGVTIWDCDLLISSLLKNANYFNESAALIMYNQRAFFSSATPQFDSFYNILSLLSECFGQEEQGSNCQATGTSAPHPREKDNNRNSVKKAFDAILMNLAPLDTLEKDIEMLACFKPHYPQALQVLTQKLQKSDIIHADYNRLPPKKQKHHEKKYVQLKFALYHLAAVLEAESSTLKTIAKGFALNVDDYHERQMNRHFGPGDNAKITESHAKNKNNKKGKKEDKELPSEVVSEPLTAVEPRIEKEVAHFNDTSPKVPQLIVPDTLEPVEAAPWEVIGPHRPRGIPRTARHDVLHPKPSTSTNTNATLIPKKKLSKPAATTAMVPTLTSTSKPVTTLPSVPNTASFLDFPTISSTKKPQSKTDAVIAGSAKQFSDSRTTPKMDVITISPAPTSLPLSVTSISIFQAGNSPKTTRPLPESKTEPKPEPTFENMHPAIQQHWTRRILRPKDDRKIIAKSALPSGLLAFLKDAMPTLCIFLVDGTVYNLHAEDKDLRRFEFCVLGAASSEFVHEVLLQHVPVHSIARKTKNTIPIFYFHMPFQGINYEIKLEIGVLLAHETILDAINKRSLQTGINTLSPYIDVSNASAKKAFVIEGNTALLMHEISPLVNVDNFFQLNPNQYTQVINAHLLYDLPFSEYLSTLLNNQAMTHANLRTFLDCSNPELLSQADALAHTEALTHDFEEILKQVNHIQVISIYNSLGVLNAITLLQPVPIDRTVALLGAFYGIKNSDHRSSEAHTARKKWAIIMAFFFEHYVANIRHSPYANSLTPEDYKKYMIWALQKCPFQNFIQCVDPVYQVYFTYIKNQYLDIDDETLKDRPFKEMISKLDKFYYDLYNLTQSEITLTTKLVPVIPVIQVPIPVYYTNNNQAHLFAQRTNPKDPSGAEASVGWAKQSVPT